MSSTKPFRAWLTLLSLICAAFTLVTANAAEDQPNILFIFTDDQAPWALGLSGDPNASTPHLDNLFQEGAYLKNAFTVTPVCSPSRASLMSSRYGTEVGITDWLHPKREAEAGLDPATPVWPRYLRDAGYRTGLVGKWHLGLTDDMHPFVFGYDTFIGFREGGTTNNNPTLEFYPHPEYDPPAIPKEFLDKADQPDSAKPAPASPASPSLLVEKRKMEGLMVDLLTDQAIDFIQEESDAPFCLSLHYRAPHTRWLPVADEDWAPFENLDPTIPNPDFPGLDVERVKRMTNEYLASVRGVDRNVGRLLEELENLGLAENTIVIFSSDHGYNMGHSGIWHKGNGHYVLKEAPPGTDNVPKGQRPNMFDRSIKVPTAVRWPGVIEPGTEIEATVSNLDWFPTLLEMGGVDVPADLTLRGQSIVPVLKGEAKDWHNDFYAEYSTKHQSQTHMRMYRTPKYKLVRDFLNEGRDEFYDLSKDPEETTNLIDSPEMKPVIEDLHGKILAQMQAIGDDTPTE